MKLFFVLQVLDDLVTDFEASFHAFRVEVPPVSIGRRWLVLEEFGVPFLDSVRVRPFVFGLVAIVIFESIIDEATQSTRTIGSNVFLDGLPDFPPDGKAFFYGEEFFRFHGLGCLCKCNTFF